MSILYANISTWSGHAANRALTAADDVMLTVETHLTEAGVIAATEDGWRYGWRCSGGPASLTGRSETGTHGGCLVQVKTAYHSTPVAAIAKDHEGRIVDSDSFAFRMVYAGAVAIMVGCGYFDCALGLKGANQAMLSAIDNLTRGGTVPFIWAIDANVPPAAWDDDCSNWKAKLKAEIIHPDVKVTCRNPHSEDGGSLIDYFLVSRSVVPLIEACTLETDVPWYPHYGVRLKLRPHPDRVFVRTLVKGKRIKSETWLQSINVIDTEEGEGLVASTNTKPTAKEKMESACLNDVGSSARWRSAVELAIKEHGNTGCLQKGEVGEAVKAYVDKIGGVNECVELDAQLSVWLKATSIYYGLLAEENGHGKIRNDALMGQYVQVKQLPLVPRPHEVRPVGGMRLPSGSNASLRV
jgi:hypothetical protein